MSAGRKNNIEKKDYNTPPKYVGAVMDFFDRNIELDPCANLTSLIESKHIFMLPMIDGLKQKWDFRTIYINPPYGRDSKTKTSIYNWVEKAKDANAYFNSEILMLIPVATNTKHFKNLIFKYFTGICFLEDTRLKFWNNGKEDPKGAPMACCFVYLGANYPKFNKIFSKYGKCFLIN